MKWTQFFEIERRPCGTAERTTALEGLAPLGYAFFCPQCGEVWAIAPIPERDFQVWTRPCRRHTYPLSLPGSLWLSWDEDFNDALPEGVVRREFELHLTAAEKEIGT